MEPELVSIAIVANAPVMYGKITVGNEIMCPLSKIIPEDPVLFGGTVYKCNYTEQYINQSMTNIFHRGNGTSAVFSIQ